MTARRKRKTEEARLQSAICQHLIFRSMPGVIFFHVPNGMVSDPVTVSRMKAQGLLPGVADLVIFIPERGRDPFALLMEVKAAKGRMSEAQICFKDDCAAINLAYHVVNSIDQAVSILTKYGAIKPDHNQSSPLRKAA